MRKIGNNYDKSIEISTGYPEVETRNSKGEYQGQRLEPRVVEDEAGVEGGDQVRRLEVVGGGVVVVHAWLNYLNPNPEVGIYKRKQVSKTKSKKTRSRLRKRPRKRSRKKMKDFFLDRILGRERVFFSLFLLIAFLVVS